MIALSIQEKRRRRFDRLSQIVEPDEMTQELLSMSGRLVMPIRYATSLYDWLRTCHAKIGLGFHDSMWAVEEQLDRSIYSLRVHPAMNGYGMLGRRNTLPISCWQHDVIGDIPMCNIDGAGEEGFLVPQKARFDGSYDHYTFWTFVKMPHGKPRHRDTMFISDFRNENRHEKDAFAAKAKADRKARLGN